MPTVQVDSRIIHYLSAPEPLDPGLPVLVLVHGAGGSSSLWNLLAAQLRPIGIPTVRIDLPGHGRSDLPGEETVSAYAAVVTRCIKALKLERVVLGGHSMGGGIAIDIALDRPAWLTALVLVSTGGRLRVLPAFLQMLEKHDREALEVSQRFSFGTGVDPEILDASFRELSACDPEVLYRDFVACDRYDNLERLPRIDLPTLVACGDADLMTPVKYSRHLASSIPGAHIEVIPGAGHMLPLERPAELAQAIGTFWQELVRS